MMSQESKRPSRQQLITKYCSSTEDDSPIKTKFAKRGKPSPLKPRKPKKPAKLKVEPKSPVLREWLKKGSKPKETSPKKSKKKMPTLNRNDSFEEECKKNNRKMKLLLKTVGKNQEHKKWMDEFRELEKISVQAYVPLNNNEIIPGKPLDCYDMSIQEIREGFYKNIGYLTDISEEKIPNRRHKLFKSKQRDKLTMNSLSYNVSMIAFTKEHKQYLANKLSKRFESKGDSYYFKVLLPELCLKIFMDRYDMTYDEAYQYLDEAIFDDDIK